MSPPFAECRRFECPRLGVAIAKVVGELARRDAVVAVIAVILTPYRPNSEAPMNDLYTLIAAEVAKATLSELYLVAGVGFGMMNAPAAVRRITDLAQVGFDGAAHDLLAVHMDMAVGSPGISNELDGFSGVRFFEGFKVEFTVRQIAEFPLTYRALFSRSPATSS